MKNIFTFLAAMLLFCCPAFGQIITTVAGDSTRGFNGDTLPAVECELNDPSGVAVDSFGNFYFCDRDNNRICKVNTSGIMTTIAGDGIAGYSGNGTIATGAELYWPYGIAVDKRGNVYFADGENSCIRMISTLGIITTVAGVDTAGYNGDGIPATTAKLNFPPVVAVDLNGNIYIADAGNNRIRKITTDGIISTFAGNGISGYSGDNGLATSAEINNPYGIAVDGVGNIYIADMGNFCVRKVNDSGIISTIAGTGMPGYSGDGSAATAAQIRPLGIAVDIYGNIYIADANYSVVRMVNTSGIISTIAGNGIGFYNGDNQPATDADLYGPTGVAVDANGSIYIADFYNNRIRFIKNSLGINNLNKINGEMKVYPNPSNGTFSVYIPPEINNNVTITIFNEYGQFVKEINGFNNQPIIITLDVPGLYFLKVISENENLNKKIVIK